MQQDLLVSTLPLGLDAGRRQANLARDTSPATRPRACPCSGRAAAAHWTTAHAVLLRRGLQTLERFNPWDRMFINGLMLANGLQGSGKTMFGIVTAARLLPYGVNVTVLDRSGHWELLTQLVPGAAHLSIGAGDSHATINPWDPDTPTRRPQKIGSLRDLHELLVGDHHAGSDRYEITARERSQLEKPSAPSTRAARASSAPRSNATCATSSARDTKPSAPAARPSRSAMLASLADRLTRTSETARTPTSSTGPRPCPTTRPWWSSTRARPATSWCPRCSSRWSTPSPRSNAAASSA